MFFILQYLQTIWVNPHYQYNQVNSTWIVFPEVEYQSCNNEDSLMYVSIYALFGSQAEAVKTL